MRLTLEGNPVPAARPRVSRGRTYYPRRYEQALEYWRLQARQQTDGPFPRDARLAVSVVFYRETRTRADVDNLVKTVLDALTGAVMHDDDQVDLLRARVVRGVGKGKGRADVTVRVIPNGKQSRHDAARYVRKPHRK